MIYIYCVFLETEGPPGQRQQEEEPPKNRRRWWLSLSKESPSRMVVVEEDECYSDHDCLDRRRSSVDPPSGGSPPPRVATITDPHPQIPYPLPCEEEIVFTKTKQTFELNNKELPKKKALASKRKLKNLKKKVRNKLLVKGAPNLWLERCTHVKYRD